MPYGPSVSRRGVLVSGTASAAVVATAVGAETAVSPQASAAPMPVTFEVNGKSRHLDLDPRTTLLDALREHLQLTGTKKGCDHGQCGACTVHIGGVRKLACMTL